LTFNNSPDLHASSQAGDPYDTEGCIDVTLSKEARQDLPVGDISNQYDFVGDVSDPDPVNDIEVGGSTGADVPFDAVGTFEYPNFGDWPKHQTGFAGALKRKGELD
jgi:hypothetical protein